MSLRKEDDDEEEEEDDCAEVVCPLTAAVTAVFISPTGLDLSKVVPRLLDRSVPSGILYRGSETMGLGVIGFLTAAMSTDLADNGNDCVGAIDDDDDVAEFGLLCD